MGLMPMDACVPCCSRHTAIKCQDRATTMTQKAFVFGDVRLSCMDYKVKLRAGAARDGKAQDC